MIIREKKDSMRGTTVSIIIRDIMRGKTSDVVVTSSLARSFFIANVL
jgi:hypothetical protein